LLPIFFAKYIVLKKDTKTIAREPKPKIVVSIIFYHILFVKNICMFNEI
jgi:hypothetical protein